MVKLNLGMYASNVSNVLLRACVAVQESFVCSPDYCHTAVVTAELMRHGGQYSAAASSLFLH